MNGFRGQERLYTSALDCIKKSVKNEGVLSLYRGLGVATFRQISAIPLQYALYSVLRETIH